jgi:hypothetical protein
LPRDLRGKKLVNCYAIIFLMSMYKFIVLLIFFIAEEWHLFKTCLPKGHAGFPCSGRARKKILSAHVCVRLRLNKSFFQILFILSKIISEYP